MVIGDFRLCGKVDNIYNNIRFAFSYSGLKPKDRLRQWIIHLALDCFTNDDTITSKFAASDKWLQFSPLSDNMLKMKNMLQIYRQGLCAPLHFFVQTSLVYAAAMSKVKTSPFAENRARQCWQGDRYKQGEKTDDYYRLCFGKAVNPLDDGFRQLAKVVWEPVIEAEKITSF